MLVIFRGAQPVTRSASTPAVLMLPVLIVLLAGAGVDEAQENDLDNGTQLAVSFGGGRGAVTLRSGATTPDHDHDPRTARLRRAGSGEDSEAEFSFNLSSRDLQAIGRCELPPDLYAAIISNKDLSNLYRDGLVGILWNS